MSLPRPGERLGQAAHHDGRRPGRRGAPRLGQRQRQRAGGGAPGQTRETTTTADAPATAGPTPDAPRPTATTRPTAGQPDDTRAGAALRVLRTLTVKGRAPRTGYSREAFGQRWRDLDRNGCDQRNDVLRRDLRDLVLKAGTRGCVVLEGTLRSPYSGALISFRRGTATSSEVQIDHVVALSDAWQKGAQGWSEARREAFANDFLELRATDGRTNMSKGDGDAATWLPPRTTFRCGYVARQVAVKKKYGLWVTAAERDAMARVLARCPDQGLPRARGSRLGGGVERQATAAPPAPDRQPAPFVDGQPTYANCDAVRAAGAAPIRRGDRGYSRSLDRDGDGVGCE